MKKKIFSAVALAATIFFAPGAQAQLDWGRVIQGGAKAVQALTLSNSDIIGYVQQYINESDSKNKVLGPETTYGKRLATLTQGLTDVNGMPLNFKVYENSEVNAFACADGSVRVYSGLMDIMTDNEVLGVIGHEIGHVAHEDTKKAFKQALLNSALKDGLASTNSTVAALTDSQLGALGDALAKSKYSKKQENQADEYGYQFLKSHGKNPIAMVQAFQKLQQMEQASGQQSSFVNNLFSDHPEISKRIANMQKLCIKDGYMDKSGNPIPTAEEKAAAEAKAKADKAKSTKGKSTKSNSGKSKKSKKK
ncbi:MAG: M48 family metallopeptidase [Muribaculaceae bacterium]